ncbi:dynein heavy chain 5, axonemal-like, partial [Diaphorina citri]|uniref:Dynein heavy chain 5, axonemal-like n=1 Tax=Diaphorina citri TaxID=121845 RepID=A0A1S3D4F9_DIACI
MTRCIINEGNFNFQDICVSAIKEKDIEAKLNQLISDWSQVNLTFAPFKERGDLFLKPAETTEIIALIEDSIMVIASLAANRYNAPFKATIMEWLKNLSNSLEILESWMMIQNIWGYLEAVFSGGEISRQLPAEAKKFLQWCPPDDEKDPDFPMFETDLLPIRNKFRLRPCVELTEELFVQEILFNTISVFNNVKTWTEYDQPKKPQKK